MAWLHNGRRIKVGKSFTDDNGYKHPFNWARDVERNLNDINVVDEDGNAVIDPITNAQQVQLGLKSQWIAQTKSTANGLLTASDWYVVRNAEKSVAIPSEISTYRDAVRTATGTIETAINGCADLDAFKALFVVPVDGDGNPTGNAPIYDFPEEV